MTRYLGNRTRGTANTDTRRGKQVNLGGGEGILLLLLVIDNLLFFEFDSIDFSQLGATPDASLSTCIVKLAAGWALHLDLRRLDLIHIAREARHLNLDSHTPDDEAVSDLEVCFQIVGQGPTIVENDGIGTA